MDQFKLIIVEDVPLELKGTEGIIRHEIPEAEVIGTADNEAAYWKLLKQSASSEFSMKSCGLMYSMRVPTASSSKPASC